MFARHGIQNALRTPRRSMAFLLLMTLLVALLGTSLGLSRALESTLEQCRENYSTIGVVEYVGPGYPNSATVVENTAEVLAAFEAALDREDPALIGWEPTRMALGYTPQLELLTDNAYLSDHFVLQVKIRNQTRYSRQETQTVSPVVGEDGRVWYEWTPLPAISNRMLPVFDGTVNRLLYASSGLVDGSPVLVEIPGVLANIPETDYVPAADCPLIDGHYYLIHGTLAQLSMLGESYKQLSPAAYELPGLDTGVTDILDITQPDGSCAELDGSTDIEAVARTYQVTAHSLTVRATNQPADLLPFQQSELALVEGAFYTADSKGCLLSERIAESLGLQVGDTLPLSLAVREDCLIPFSYWAGEGFDAEDTYTVTGIFSANADYETTIFLPVRDDMDMQQNHCSYTLGQLQLKNGEAQAYVEQLQQRLDGSIRISVYDQGYTAVSQALEDMLRLVQIIALVCLAAGLGFLVLFGYLLVYRQRGIGQTMLRVGATRKNVHTYFLFCAGTVGLPAAVLGLVASRFVCLGVLQLMKSLLDGRTTIELLYSNTALSMQRSATEYLQAPGWGVLALIALGTLALSLLSCLLFSVVSLEDRRKKRRRVSRGAQGTRSRNLRGGALAYARLSALRGGFRSLVPVLAGVCAAILFCQLSGTVITYNAQLEQLRADSSVMGMMTDVKGKYTSGLVLDNLVIQGISELEGVSDLTYLTTMHYQFARVIRDDGIVGGPGLPKQPTTSYEEERYRDNLRAGPELVFINRLEGAPEFAYSSSIEAQWLEGYDSSFFSEQPTKGEDGYIPIEQLENRCVIPTSMMEEYGIQLGDRIWLETIRNENGVDVISQLGFRVVGAYVQPGRSDNIYVNLSALNGAVAYGSVQGGLSGVYTEQGQRFQVWFYGGAHSGSAYSGLTFRIPSCTDLTAVKQALYDMDLSAVGNIRSVRNFVLINDAAYLTTERAATQRLWYMQHLFPVVYAIALGLGYLIAYLQGQSRKKELRTMRSVGASGGTAFWSLYWEQLMLALLGAALGAGLCLALGWSTELGLLLTAAFAALWLLGALVSLSRANGRHILKNRREVE